MLAMKAVRAWMLLRLLKLLLRRSEPLSSTVHSLQLCTTTIVYRYDRSNADLDHNILAATKGVSSPTLKVALQLAS
jgi:hypothetical protein